MFVSLSPEENASLSDQSPGRVEHWHVIKAFVDNYVDEEQLYTCIIGKWGNVYEAFAMFLKKEYYNSMPDWMRAGE